MPLPNRDTIPLDVENRPDRYLKRHLQLLLKGLAWGLAAGLVLAILCLFLFRWVHADIPGERLRYVTGYFLTVGILLGLLAGWLAGLNAVLWGILDPVIWKVSGLIPATAQRIDAIWVGRLDEVMGRVLTQTSGPLRYLLLRLFAPGLAGRLERFNTAVDRFRLAKPGRVMTSQMMSYAALSQYVRPLWVFFYVAYAVVAVGIMVFLGLPFVR